MMKTKYYILLVILINITMVAYSQKTAAFPGAEGYGKYVTGGRGGDVVYVTHLKDNTDQWGAGYAGSLRAALETPGNNPITIVFKVGGVINPQADLKCARNNVTIAGQTALGDGICIKGVGLNFSGQNIIVRHIRVRVGDEVSQNYPALTFSNGRKAIFDHCSFSWSVEENVNITDVDSITFQWCINSESLFRSTHAKGDRGYAAQWGGEHASYHHNLLAHHVSRMPRQNGNTSDDYQLTWDYRNNVHYNWGNTGAFYGGGVEQPGGFSHSNLINNYYRPGPATTTSKSAQYFCAPSGGRPAVTGEGNEYDFGYGLWYLAGNVMHDNPDKTNDNWLGLGGPVEHKATSEFDAAPVTTTTAEIAYVQVLNNAGATKPKRDAIDQRVVGEVFEGSSTFGGAYGAGKGIIDTHNNLKPEGVDPSWTAWDIYEKVQSSAAPTDTDLDGIPDEWEDTNGLDKSNADDGKIILSDGYSNLEKYLNELAGEINTGTTGIHTARSDFQLYPNPVTMSLYITSTEEINAITLRNVLGQTVLIKNTANNYNTRLNVSGLDEGIYFISVQWKNGKTLTKRILKN